MDQRLINLKQEIIEAQAHNSDLTEKLDKYQNPESHLTSFMRDMNMMLEQHEVHLQVDPRGDSH